MSDKCQCSKNLPNNMPCGCRECATSGSMGDKFEDIDKAFVKWRNEKPRWRYNTTECLHTWRHAWQASRTQTLDEVAEIVKSVDGIHATEWILKQIEKMKGE